MRMLILVRNFLPAHEQIAKGEVSTGPLIVSVESMIELAFHATGVPHPLHPLHDAKLCCCPDVSGAYLHAH